MLFLFFIFLLFNYSCPYFSPIILHCPAHPTHDNSSTAMYLLAIQTECMVGKCHRLAILSFWNN